MRRNYKQVKLHTSLNFNPMKVVWFWVLGKLLHVINNVYKKVIKDLLIKFGLANNVTEE